MGIADVVKKTGTAVRRTGIVVGATAATTHALQHVLLGAYTALNIIERHTDHAHTHDHVHHHHGYGHVHHYDPSMLQQVLTHPVVEVSMIAMFPFLIWEGVHHYKTHRQNRANKLLNSYLTADNNQLLKDKESLRVRNEELEQLVESYGRQ